MNRQEFAANARLTDHVVQNLNDDPRLPFPDAEFDAAGLCVSTDYLIDPVAVLREDGAGAPARCADGGHVLQPLLPNQGCRRLARAGRCRAL